MKRKVICLITALCIFSLFAGCSMQRFNQSTSNENKHVNKDNDKETSAPVNDYDNLSKDEKLQYDQIKQAIDNNEIYKVISFSETDVRHGQIKYDFNNDGKVEILEYQAESNDSDGTISKCVLTIDGSSYSYKHRDTYEIAGDIESLNILDIDKTDDLVDFYIADGYLSDRAKNQFLAFDKGITETCDIESSILDYSGDGKLYYWEGCLDAQFAHNDLNKDLVLVYYDYNTQKYCKTDLIVGKEISFMYDIFLYNSKDSVRSGAPMTDESIEENYSDTIIKKIKAGEKLTVLSIEGVIEDIGDNCLVNQDNGIKVSTEDGIEGWIGGFHMVWD